MSYAIAMLAFSFAGFVVMYGIQRLQNVLPFNPAGQDAVSPDLAFNTSVSFMTNTNWQSYVARDDDELSDPDGRADGAQLRLRRHRHRARRRAGARLRAPLGADHRQFLGRSDALRALHPAAGCRSSWRWCSSGRACRRTSAPIPTRRRWKAPSRSSPRARWLRRKSSRCWAPTAAASSTPTRRIRSRTRTALTNFIQMLLIFSLGAGLTNLFGRMVGSERQGWAIFAVMFVLFLAGVAVTYSVESQGNPAFAPFHVDQVASATAIRRQHGRQGGALRHRQLGAVHHHHHRCVLRRRQQHA